MISESGGRAVVIASSALGSKDHRAGRFKVPLRRIRQAIYQPRRICPRNVEDKAPWRVSRRDNLPSSPSMASRNEVWKTEGVSTFPLGVLVREHGIHIQGNCFISRKKKKKKWRAGTQCVDYFTGVHSNQDLIWCVKIEVYMGFCVNRRF